MFKKLLLTALIAFFALPAFSQDKKHNFSIAFETSKYKYEEPLPAVRWTGVMSGVSARYTGKGILTPTEEFDASDPTFVNIDFTYMTGNVDYKGRTQSGTPLELNDIKDYFVESRIAFGAVYEVPKISIEFLPYIGFGVRYLKDGLGKHQPSGYDRKSTYLYSPIGVDAKVDAGKGWGLTFNAEYDLFWHGTQQSLMGELTYAGYTFDVNPKNDQDSGYGVRLSVKADKNFNNKFGVFIEPFFRFWHVDNSAITKVPDRTHSVALSFVEPKNETTEWGLRAGVMF